MAGTEGGASWYDPNLYAPSWMQPGAIGTYLGDQGGMQGGQGYAGQVSNLQDFLSAVLGGVGAVLGGPLAAPMAVGALVGSGGKTMSPMQALKGLFGRGSSSSDGAPGLSSGVLEVNPANAGGFGTGALGGTMAGGLSGGINGGFGDITGGGNAMNGFGDHEHTFAKGGALNAAIRSRRRR